MKGKWYSLFNHAHNTRVTVTLMVDCYHCISKLEVLLSEQSHGLSCLKIAQTPWGEAKWKGSRNITWSRQRLLYQILFQAGWKKLKKIKDIYSTQCLRRENRKAKERKVEVTSQQVLLVWLLGGGTGACPLLKTNNYFSRWSPQKPPTVPSFVEEKSLRHREAVVRASHCFNRL